MKVYTSYYEKHLDFETNKQLNIDFLVSQNQLFRTIKMRALKTSKIILLNYFTKINVTNH